MEQACLSQFSDYATGWMTEKLRYRSRQGKEIFLSSTASGSVLRSTQLPIL
jgi:hypothetical protein